MSQVEYLLMPNGTKVFSDNPAYDNLIRKWRDLKNNPTTMEWRLVIEKSGENHEPTICNPENQNGFSL